jgi:pimeloyl-ACP methyl ester carboxylesterase
MATRTTIPRNSGGNGRRTCRRTATLHGDQIRFWDSAPAHGAVDEDPVVLVHGIAASAHTWAPLFAELARRRDQRRVIAPDLLGHGASAAPWADYSLGGYATGLRDLLVALGHSRATIVGHSLGGGIAAQFAFQFPQHCGRLVLVDSGGLGREVSPLLRASTLPGAEWILPLLTEPRIMDAARTVALAARWAVPGLSPSAWESGRSFASLANPVHRRAFLHTARSVLDFGGQRVQATRRLYLADGFPTLIAWGTADSMIPVEHAHRAHELIPGSQLALFDGAGHFPHCDQPQRFTERLVEFLDNTTPARIRSADLAARIAAHAELEEVRGTDPALRNQSGVPQVITPATRTCRYGL